MRERLVHMLDVALGLDLSKGESSRMAHRADSLLEVFIAIFADWLLAEVRRGFPAFHSFRKPISENTVNQALRRLGYSGVMTAHGFRSTASTQLNESKLWSPDAIERALAQEDKNAVRAAYNRTDYWDERVEMMQWWSDRLDALKASAN